MTPEIKPIRVSVSEAAKLFGVSTATIRKAITSKELRYIVVRERYKINFEDLISWSQKSARRSGQFHKKGIGQFASRWRIKNRLYSPDERLAQEDTKENK